ncbi:MAG: hypothetical protein FWD57_12635, partial [Polyangiaceae bacterium]|nr:hypothetical protein [Polyangiaceae bacterium]
NADYTKCEQCLLVFGDMEGSYGETLFAHQSGTLTIKSSVDDLWNHVIDATLEDVKLVEIDSEFNPVPNGLCLTIDNAPFVAAPIEGWTCPKGYYEDGDCDCECGIWDPDCSTSGANPFGCAPEAICVEVDGQGICDGGVVGWTCDIKYYGDGFCECGCGAWDPDCDDFPIDLFTCGDVERCFKDDDGKPYCDLP